MKVNKFQDTLKEYAKKLSDDDLRWLNTRLTQRIGGDVGEAIEFMQDSQEMDRWLQLNNSAAEFFEMVDQIDIQLQYELKKRFSLHEQKAEKSKSA
jgi:hypothetical protein